MLSVLPSEIQNYKDLIRWLFKRRDSERSSLEAVKSILIPLYIAVLAMHELLFPGSDDTKMILMLIVILIVELIALRWLNNAMCRVRFYEDFIEIANDQCIKEKASSPPEEHYHY